MKKAKERERKKKSGFSSSPSFLFSSKLLGLVDSPDMVRSQMNFKRLALTNIKIDIKRIPNKKNLIAAMEAADFKGKWENSSWGRKLLVQKRRAALPDFGTVC